MKNEVLTIVSLLAMGFTTAYGSFEQHPKMNGKLKVCALAPEEIRYTGKPYNKDLGAYVFSCRDYNPEMGRWITQDPSGFPVGPNNYIYTAAPTSEFDPSGLEPPSATAFWSAYSPYDYATNPEPKPIWHDAGRGFK